MNRIEYNDKEPPFETRGIALLALGRCFTGLKISGRGEVDEDTLRSMSGAGPQLTRLELSDCSRISSRALGILLHGACRITDLDLSGSLTIGDE